MKLVIKQERLERGWTQEQVAQKVGITNQAINLIESGQRKPSYSVLEKLLNLFEYTDPRLLFAVADKQIITE